MSIVNPISSNNILFGNIKIVLKISVQQVTDVFLITIDILNSITHYIITRFYQNVVGIFNFFFLYFVQRKIIFFFSNRYSFCGTETTIEYKKKT